jgi:uncharacterized protein DUF6445
VEDLGDFNMLMTYDNFCPDVESVRKSFLDAGFGTWVPASAKVGSGKYEGMGFMGNHAPLLGALTRNLGRSVIPNRMFARITNEHTERAYIHSDRTAGDFTCIVYLSDHKDEQSGTGFYRHKETGLTEMPVEWMDDPKRQKEMVDGSEDVWDTTNFIEGAFNTALVFNAPLFHSRFPMNGIGTDDKTGRLVWACHFFL